MRIAFVRIQKGTLRETSAAAVEKARMATKASSSSKNLILALQSYGFADECVEWRFWHSEPPQDVQAGLLPVQDFACDDHEHSASLERYVAENGAPDILWVEGRTHPAYLQYAFDLCPRSFKINYSKHWRPWQVDDLERYDLSLVDEEWQANKLERRHPSVHAGIWDKLVDYDQVHYPLDCDKTYDICYIAYLRGRKNHELLLRAMARLPERNLTAVFVGGGRGHREELERLANELHLAVRFVGEVAKEEINRYVNASRIGVMCARKDAVPRAILEYMAADVPVLVNSELMAGTRYVGAGAGLVRSPEEFHVGIAELLDHLDAYTPRAYLLEHHSRRAVAEKFMGILEQAGYDAD